MNTYELETQDFPLTCPYRQMNPFHHFHKDPQGPQGHQGPHGGPPSHPQTLHHLNQKHSNLVLPL